MYSNHKEKRNKYLENLKNQKVKLVYYLTKLVYI